MSVRAAYDEWAGTYDEMTNSTRDLDAVVLRRQEFALAGWDVLEFGCGTGKNTEWLARQSRSLVAMDFSEGMLARARTRVGEAPVRLVQHDVCTPWPFEAGRFDLVVGNLVLEHVESFAPVFTEAARVLRPGGRLFLCELHPCRQYKGTQARFPHPESGELIYVPAFVHDVSEYVNGGVEAGLELLQTADWREEQDAGDKTALPRLFSVVFRRP